MPDWTPGPITTTSVATSTQKMIVIGVPPRLAAKPLVAIVNYAQWESVEAFQAMLADPAAQKHTRAGAAIASYDPHLYTVESVHHS